MPKKSCESILAEKVYCVVHNPEFVKFVHSFCMYIYCICKVIYTFLIKLKISTLGCSLLIGIRVPTIFLLRYIQN